MDGPLLVTQELYQSILLCKESFPEPIALDEEPSSDVFDVLVNFLKRVRMNVFIQMSLNLYWAIKAFSCSNDKIRCPTIFELFLFSHLRNATNLMKSCSASTEQSPLWRNTSQEENAL